MGTRDKEIYSRLRIELIGKMVEMVEKYSIKSISKINQKKLEYFYLSDI